MFYRIVTHAGLEDTPLARSRARRVQKVFPGAFAKVWSRIPLEDRREMLLYWRRDLRPQSQPQSTPQQAHFPLVEVIDVGSASPPEPAFEHSQTRFQIPGPLVTGETALLKNAIARLMAESHLYATGKRQDLWDRLVEEPMQRWEAQHGFSMDGEAPNASPPAAGPGPNYSQEDAEALDELDAAQEAEFERVKGLYAPEHEREVNAVLRAWGLPEPSNDRA